MFDFVSHNFLIKKLVLYDIVEARGKWIKNPISDGRDCPWRREPWREGERHKWSFNTFPALHSVPLDNLDMKN